MTATDTTTKLEKARLQYEQAQQAAQQEADDRAVAAQARLEAHDRAALDAFDDQALGDAIARELTGLRDSIATDDGPLGALARLYGARLVRTYRRQEAQDIAMRLGDTRYLPPPMPVHAVTVEELLRAVADVGEAINLADLDRREVARQAAGEAA